MPLTTSASSTDDRCKRLGSLLAAAQFVSIGGRLHPAIQGVSAGSESDAKKAPKLRKVRRYQRIALPIGSGCKLVDSDSPKTGKLRLSFGWRGFETMTVRYHSGGRPLPDKVHYRTIKHTGDGKLWLSFAVEVELAQKDDPSTGEGLAWIECCNISGR